ncbi:hypothetical protein [Actinomadura rudentiformis]|nr:hypothetical protein [Actinomadura rudentiformis]
MTDPPPIPPEAEPEAHHATEADEDRVLVDIYGEPDPDGFYRGGG